MRLVMDVDRKKKKREKRSFQEIRELEVSKQFIKAKCLWIIYEG